MNEVGTRQTNRTTERVEESTILDEHARHRERKERIPGEGHEVDAREDGHTRHGQRQKRDCAYE
jgi:hypothetical protein